MFRRKISNAPGWSTQPQRSPRPDAQEMCFRELETAFVYLITMIIEAQDSSGWWGPEQLHQNLMTAHAVRLLHRMGLPLSVRWNLSKGTSREGNLYHATKL